MKNCCWFKQSKCVSPINPQPLENFARDRKQKDGRTLHCKSCLKLMRDATKEQRNETIKKWRERNPDRMKQYRINQADQIKKRGIIWREKNLLKFRYGIDRNQWNVMFEKQFGRCFICDVHHDDLVRGLCVDHCHSTNKVRGLLCHPCNQAIGLLKDDVIRIRRAVEYLEN